MAGAGYKLFATGDVLTAAQVNTYLMQQTVMVFASSAARTSALSGVLAEGMVSYLQDTNTLEVYDGSGWVGATGDITGLTAGTGISISSATGPVPTVGIDTAVTADLTTAQTLTNKTLTNPVLTTPSISNINAKGDILVGTADNTLGVITAGSNGESLVADSSTSTGLRYQQPKTFNTLINANFDWWQRGTSFAGLSSSTYTADRWKTLLSGTSLNATLSQDTSVPNVRSKYSAKLQQLTSSATSVSEFGFLQIIETSNILPLCGNTVTLSFWYKSSITGTHYYRIYTAYQTGGVDTTSTFTVTAADTWEYKTITLSAFAAISAIATAPTAAGAEIQIGARIFGSGGTSTIAANGYVQISQVQMEVGSVATVFARAGGTIQGELAACQRYYYQTSGQYVTSSSQYTSTTCLLGIKLPVTMRTTPSYTAGTGAIFYNGSSQNPTFASNVASVDSYGLQGTTSSVTVGYAEYANLNNDHKFSAEL